MAKRYPIKHWSYSSLMAYLRNPLAWYKRYVEEVRDTPSTPSGVIGRAGHVALQHYYGGLGKDAAIELGLESLRAVADFEIDFGKAKSLHAKKLKRKEMERDYHQAVGFYLARAPKYKKIHGIEVSHTARVKGLPLPIKAISDLVVSGEPGTLDIIDHKFVDSFSHLGADKPLFVLQAIFNYYTVSDLYKMPVARFILQECKKRKNKDGSSQMRRTIITFADCADDFEVFGRLIKDASRDISRARPYLPNPSDMFEGKNSYEVYKMQL